MSRSSTAIVARVPNGMQVKYGPCENLLRGPNSRRSKPMVRATQGPDSKGRTERRKGAVNSIRDSKTILARHRGQGETLDHRSHTLDFLRERELRRTSRSEAKALGVGCYLDCRHIL